MTAPTARAEARRCLERGWAPIPVPFRSKNPGFEGWTDCCLTEDDLETAFPDDPSNLGVLLGAPSSGLVDADLDTPEARAVADAFLPPTPCRFGRPSASNSHRMFLASGSVATTKYRDPTKPDDGDRA